MCLVEPAFVDPQRTQPAWTGAVHRRAPQTVSPRYERGRGCLLGEVDPPLALEEVDEGVDGRGLEGVAAHQERVETQGLAEVVVFDVLGDRLVDGTVARDASAMATRQPCRRT